MKTDFRKNGEMHTAILGRFAVDVEPCANEWAAWIRFAPSEGGTRIGTYPTEEEALAFAVNDARAFLRQSAEAAARPVES